MDTLGGIENYISVLLSNPNIDPFTVLSMFFLTLARILPILAIAPFLGGQNVPAVIRMMFAVALTAIFLPANIMKAHIMIPFAAPFIGYFLKELMIGFFLGFMTSIPFYTAQMAGGLVDFQRGASSLQVTDPTTKTQTGAIGVLYNYVLIALFYSFGGPILFFSGLATSYDLVPVDGLINPEIFNLQHSVWDLILTVAQKMFNLCIQLSAPALIGILFIDMFLGISNRMAPQVQIVFLGMPLKSWVGIALLAAAWGLIIQVMTKETLDWFKMIERFISITNFS